MSDLRQDIELTLIEFKLSHIGKFDAIDHLIAAFKKMLPEASDKLNDYSDYLRGRNQYRKEVLERLE